MTDATPGERVALACPSCSPDRETVHEVVKPAGRATVRCTDCDHVHKERLPEPERTPRRVVVSQDGDSFTTEVEVPDEEDLAVGEEFLVETPEAIHTVRITSLELDGDRRVEEAGAGDVRTIWSRAVGNVRVDVTVHPADGRHDATESTDLYVPGDEEFVVGEETSAGEEAFTVEGFLVRDDARGYDRERFDHAGDSVRAKDVKRLYVRDRTTRAWSAW